jgi:4-hydroxybenzoate polyprenyltransferase
MNFHTFFQLIRFSQWTKSIFLFLGIIYSGSYYLWPSVFIAALAFSFISSAIYIYNDIHDIEEDRQHPEKSKRPLANQSASMTEAIFIMAFLLVFGLALAYLVSQIVVFIVLLYLLINVMYNIGLRSIPILDVLCVSSGFMLRILAGTIGVGLALSGWLTITGTLLSLFVALCKRLLENKIPNSRLVLKKYTAKMLERSIYFSALGCFISYILYVYLIKYGSFYFVLTIPFAGFGLFRLTYLTFSSIRGEDPLILLFSDIISVCNFSLFMLLTLLAFYA